MTRSLLPFLAMLMILFSVMPAAAQSATRLMNRVNWPQFMARHDLVWEALPETWQEGAFLGNGLLGAMIYLDDEKKFLRWDVGRSDVTDRGSRIPLGQMVLATQGVLQGGTMRLDLWNAEARGTLQTDKGEIRWRSFTHTQDMVTIVELQTTSGESGCRWEWRSGLAANARKVHNREPIGEDEKNPEPVLSRNGEVQLSTQTLKAGGEHTTAWRDITLEPNHRVLMQTVSYSRRKPGDPPGGPTTRYHATETIQRAATSGLDKLLETHRAWWHEYYPQSFVSIPDTRLESFYWIQMYKLASATRADRPLLDLMGPWFRSTPWPAIWWNLNVQLTYWPVYAANRLELGESLTRALDANAANLALNVPENMRADAAAIGRVTSYDLRGGVSDERGNLTWALHNYWLQYRYSMDETMLRERLYPLLRRSINYYLHILETGEDGKLHLPVSVSPEYPIKAADTNYDLALLRWGLDTLIETSARLKLDDPSLPKWKSTLERLTPYPSDEKTGLMIGRDVPLAQSHRHFSHLLMIYPLRLMNWEQPHNRLLIARSLDHWIGFKGALQGYSYTGAAAISSMIGRNNDAARLLNEFLDGYVKPNTMYLEAGPVIETPLAGAASLHEILLQSWGGTLRVFPAMPAVWRDVTFHDMRAEGAFLVSGARRGGRTQWVRVTSLAGEPCRVQTDLSRPLQVIGSRKYSFKARQADIVEIDLRRGETVILKTRGTNPPLVIEPVAPQKEQLNFYGSRKVPPIEQTVAGFDLHASKAIIHGDSLLYEKSATKDNLGRWISDQDWAGWKLNVTRPGRFRVLLTYASPGAGGPFSVAVGEETVKSEVKPTGSFEKFQQFEIGTLNITKSGRVELEVRPLQEPEGGLMNLQRVLLVPLR